MNFGDTKALRAELLRRNDKDFQNGDVWQAILNIGYAKWQSSESLAYDDMTSWMRIEFGVLAEFCILAGKYNQQVCNGGHEQYFDNGYASCGEDRYPYEECELHLRLIRHAKKLGVDGDEIGKKVYEIWKRFRLRDYGFDDDDHDRVADGDELNRDYYAINEEWEQHFSKLLKDAFVAELAFA